MHSKSLILHGNGKIFIFPERINISDIELQKVEFKLKQYTTSIQYHDKIREFDFDDYSIWSLIIMGEEILNEFITFLEQHAVNEFPEELTDKINNITKTFKQVLLDEDLESIIVKVLKGDLNSIYKKTLKKYLIFDESINGYKGEKKNYDKVRDVLLKNKVNIKLDNYIDLNINEPLEFKCKFKLRYYEIEAVKSITQNGHRGGIIFMPPGSGKSYVALKLVESYKIPTLILCDNSQEYWENFIKTNTDLADDKINVFDSSNKIASITICSYQRVNLEKLNILKSISWGIIIYDDAHRTPADTYSQTLYIKSKYKYALAATLSRSDGKEAYLYDIIGPKIYNIKWQELRLRKYYKDVKYYKVLSRTYDPINICKKIIDANKDRKILICSHLLTPNEKISQAFNIPNINGNTGKQNEAKLLETFNLGQVSKICISKILQRLQVTNIDILIAISHNGSSKTEEIFRVGRAACCSEMMEKVQQATIYSIVNPNKADSFNVRLEEVIKNGYKYIPIDDIKLMEEL